MKFAFSPNLEKSFEMLVIPFWEGPIAAAEYSSLELSAALKDFTGKNGESSLLYQGSQRVLLLGLGKKEKATVEALRRAYSSAVRCASSKKIKHISILFPTCKQSGEFLQGIIEGLLLTNYSFTYKHDSLKTNPIVLLEKITLVGVQKTDYVERLLTIVDGVHFVRDLVNSNADDKIEMFLKAAKNLHPKVKTTVLDKKKLEAGKFGLILAVNRSSSLDPHLVQVSYKGDPKSKEHIVLVGKGVTYDTGGLSLKPTDGMVSMKCDMAGSATVLGAVKTAAELGLKVNVTALAPLTENCIGSKSYKLGDVYRSYSGKTVEINNTDAEGRLVLADAIAYAVDKLDPSCIIDLATLTGACVVALGDDIAGLVCNDEILAESLLEASECTDELLCRFPTHNEYLDDFKSDIADLKNSSGREAGAIKAGLFLQEFAGQVPWAHIDIAGPAYVPKPKFYNTTKATGYGVRLLLEYLEANGGA
ncbi:MAG: aminopeptidase [Chlamydiae bacterium CG10_big_fil_rev_8_21_14_0_10_42_34]|nr:MAG: aminopeptidase [Chlamydiae bacterium CG10_big_fil_rev_8_21_14_0_10_42_34]